MTIDDIKKEIAALGPIHPGVLNKQMIKCGKDNCRCKNGGDDRHGPYFQVSWTLGGKSGSKHIKSNDVADMKERIKNYKKLQALLKQLFQASITVHSVMNDETKE